MWLTPAWSPIYNYLFQPNGWRIKGIIGTKCPERKYAWQNCIVILRVNLIDESGRYFWGSKPITEELLCCFDEKNLVSGEIRKPVKNIVSGFFAKRSMSYSMYDNSYLCTVFEFRHGSKSWYWQIPLYWWTKRYGTQHGWLGFPKNHRGSFVAVAIGCYAHWCKQ